MDEDVRKVPTDDVAARDALMKRRMKSVRNVPTVRRRWMSFRERGGSRASKCPPVSAWIVTSGRAFVAASGVLKMKKRGGFVGPGKCRVCTFL
eukprot:gene11469-12827_t